MMRVLGIETSCDDTAIGIVNYAHGKLAIEAQTAASQVLIHRKYGGVVPEVAAREHAITILPTIKAALQQASAGWDNIDAIAVTGGPGLNTALLVGVETARALSYSLKKPLVRINHIEGHICSAWAANKPIRFPAVALIVSGGHTELIEVKKFGSYRLLGKTVDDAVGEAFDKVAKILGLPYPGGPEISRLAELGDSSAIAFPRSFMRPGNLEFSYSGLKTSVLYAVRDTKHLTEKIKQNMAASFQAAAIEPLVTKTMWAAKIIHAKTVILGGGVAANKQLRKKLATMVRRELPGTVYREPVLPLCTDNGVMIAIAACLRIGSGRPGALRAQKKDYTPWKKITADPNWELV